MGLAHSKPIMYAHCYLFYMWVYTSVFQKYKVLKRKKFVSTQ